MRLWALDASDPDGRSLRGLVPREGQVLPDVILLFGGAADAAAAQAAVDRQRRDESFLDTAAVWLLEGNGAPPPTRAAPSAWLRRVRVVSDAPPARFAPLVVTERHIEIVDTLLLMAVPSRETIGEDALVNASVWIAGALAAPVLEPRETRAVLSPGDYLETEARLELELSRGRLEARVVRADGSEEAQLGLGLSPRTKMSVRG